MFINFGSTMIGDVQSADGTAEPRGIYLGAFVTATRLFIF
jgi:hypothetical protein